MKHKLSPWICQRCQNAVGIHVEGAALPEETRVAFCFVCDDYTEQKLERKEEVNHGRVDKSC